MSIMLGWLGTQLVTVVIASVTSALTVLLLLSRVFTRLTMVENSLLGSKAAEIQVSELRSGMEKQVTQLRLDMDRRELDSSHRLDRIDSQYAAIAEGAARSAESLARSAESLKWIRDAIVHDRADLIARIADQEARYNTNSERLWEKLSELTTKLPQLHQPQPLPRRRK